MIGQTILHYEILELLGKGGMGEVYRARDTKLGRDVALKILPTEVAEDPERAARFAREARTLASLQHPNIAAIHGYEEADGTRFLTMELAEGEDLSELILRGAIPVEEAERIARQIAAGLEAAHDKGVVHRDLKPANIKIGSDGAVKILDFGLARAYVGEAADGADPENSPTITAAMTQAGVILGTAAYMSPEQARGRAVDSRADIWAFGIVLFEMISGQRLFTGETVSDTLASVLKTEVDWDQLPGDLPPRIRTLLVRSLDRDRERRLRDIGEARIALDDELSGAPDQHLESALQSGVISTDATSTGESAGGKRWLPIVGALVVGAILAILGTQVLAPTPTVEVPLRKLTLGIDVAGERASEPVIAPDGTAVAYYTPTHIVVREMHAREARRFPVSEPIQDLFWSPDGGHLAYITDLRLYRLDALSGQQQVVCVAVDVFTAGSGGTWSEDGTILFSQADTQGFFRVSDRGGDAHQVLPTDPDREGDFHDPHALPAGRGVIFVPHRTDDAFAAIEVWDGEQRKVVVELPGQMFGAPIYSPTGHILFHRAGSNPGIWAIPFSLEDLEATGEPFLVASSGTAPSISSDGTLVYHSGSTSQTLRLTWNDAAGIEIGGTEEIAIQTGYMFPSLTQDGRLACAGVADGETEDLWVFDVGRGTRTRLTFGSGREEWPVWSPSGDAVFYHIRPEGSSAIEDLRLMRIDADGTSQPDTLAVGFIPSVSPDGKYVTFSVLNELDHWMEADIAYRPVDGDRSEDLTVVSASGLQVDGRVSPTGDYMAYMSSESGSEEIYLTRFPSGEGRWQVSVDGGWWPRWKSSGDQLFYIQDNQIMAVDVTLGDRPRLGRPRVMIERPALGMSGVGNWEPGFDVSGDGEQFLYFRDPTDDAMERHIVVVQNWYSEFEERE